MVLSNFTLVLESGITLEKRKGERRYTADLGPILCTHTSPLPYGMAVMAIAK